MASLQYCNVTSAPASHGHVVFATCNWLVTCRKNACESMQDASQKPHEACILMKKQCAISLHVAALTPREQADECIPSRATACCDCPVRCLLAALPLATSMTAAECTRGDALRLVSSTACSKFWKAISDPKATPSEDLHLLALGNSHPGR